MTSEATPPRDPPGNDQPHAASQGALIPGGAIARWLAPGLALLLWVGAVARFVERARANPPPAPLLRLPGFGDWTARATYRRHCAFTGQFLAVDEQLWTICTPDALRWELLRWDLPRQRAERRWPVTAVEGDLQRVTNVTMGPAIAAALRRPDGGLALVVHGLGPKAPLRLLEVRPAGGVTAYSLPGLSPGALVGFAARGGGYALVTADGRLHRLTPGQALRSGPLPGLPPTPGVVVELAEPRDPGWRLVYSLPPDKATPDRYALHLIPGPGIAAVPLGTLREGSRARRGERLDPSPGNVLPVHLAQWPSHRLEGTRLAPLPSPAAGLLDGLPAPSPIGTQVVRLLPGRQERLWAWSATALGGAPSPGAQGRTIRRWRWLQALPTGWIAGERLAQGLRLEGAPRALSVRIPMARVPFVMQALPAKGGGLWLFDSSGTVLRLGADLSWKNRPGLGDRLARIWRREHLEPGALAFQGGRPIPPDRWRGLADRWALPVVLLGGPLALLLGVILAGWRLRRAGVPRPWRTLLRRPTAPLLVPTVVYLGFACLLLWRFWTVTAAL